MNSTGFKIGIALLTGIGIGMIACAWRQREDPCSCEESSDSTSVLPPSGQSEDRTESTASDPARSSQRIINKRTMPATEIVQPVPGNPAGKNTTIRTKPANGSQAVKDSQDLARWGTTQGLIEVAENLIDKQRKRRITTEAGDKQRWGTQQGLIDVANELQDKQRKRQTLSRMQNAASGLSQKLSSPQFPKMPQVTSAEQWYHWLNHSFERTQVSITNTSAQEKTIHLWGAHSELASSPPAPEEVEDHAVKTSVAVPVASGTAVHPQGVIINPANGFAYVANQLSNNVSVIAPDGQLVHLVQLQPSSLPGLNSPVAVAVNTDQNSSDYGKVYVAGSVANSVSVIDLHFQVTNEIAVGLRPVALAFNPVNGRLYVANLVGNDVSVIDTQSETLALTIPVGLGPVGVGINPTNGDVYIANTQANTVSVIKQSHVIATIPALGVNPVSFAYHPLNDKMYLTLNGSNHVVPIDPVQYSIEPPIPVGFRPYGIVYNPNNNFLYVGNIKDQTYSVIAADHSIRDTIQVGPLNIGLAIDEVQNLIYSTDTPGGLVNIIGYKDQSSAVQLDADYTQKASLFQHSPAIIKHVKFVLSGAERFRVLTLKERTVTGRETYTPISFSSYENPQNFLNVSEVSALDGVLLNGTNTWVFKIAPGQTITILIYYRQLDMSQVLPHSVTYKTKNYESIT